MAEIPKESGNGTGTSATIVGDKTGTKTLARAENQIREAQRWANMRLEPRKRDFARRYAQYRGNMSVFTKDTIQGNLRSQIYVNKSGALVETVIPRTIGDNPKIELVASRPQDEDAVEPGNALLDYYARQMRLQKVLYMWWKDALIYGTGVVETVWSYKEELRPPMAHGQHEQRAIGDRADWEVAVIEDMPRVNYVDMMDFYFDHSSRDIERMDFVMKRYELPPDVVGSRIDTGLYTGIGKSELLAYTMQGREAQIDTTYKDERDRAIFPNIGLGTDTGSVLTNRIEQLRKVVLYDYWGRFDLDGDGKDEQCLITAVGDQIGKVVRVIPIPYWDGRKPFVSANYIPVANDFLGVGLMEWVEQLQREINTRYNMGVDNANYILNTMMKVVRSANIPDAQLKSRPSGRIDVNDPNDVTPLDMPVIFDKLIGLQSVNDQLWQEITGISSEYTGVRQQAGSAMHRTAGGIMALQQAADTRLRQSRLNFEEQSVKQVGELLISRIQQYMDSPVMLSLLGPEGTQYLTVEPWQLRGAKFSVKVAISPTEALGKFATRERWVQIMAVLSQRDPQMMYFDWPMILNDWMKAMDLPNGTKYLGQFAEKLNLMHQTAIMEQMMGGAGAQPGQEGGGGKQLGQQMREFSPTPGARGAMAAGGERGRAAE